MTQYLGPKTSGANIATQSDIGGSSFPTGLIMPYAGSAAPSGFLICDGSNINRTTYSALFAIVGTTYGSGDGSTTFGLPNLLGRVVVGIDASQTEFDTRGETGGAKTHTLATTEIPSHNHASGSLAANTGGSHAHNTEGGAHTHTYDRSTISVSTGSNFNRTGSSNGVTGVTLTNTSTNSGSTTPSGKTSSNGDHTHSISGSTGNSGSGGSHNNLQPYMALAYIIKT